MFESFKEIFGLDYESKIKRELKEYISHLPTCSSGIVIGSPQYGSQIFNCEIIVDACDLLDWLREHCARCSVSFVDRILLSWLPAADINDKRLTYLEHDLLRAIEGYEERLIKFGKATVICGTCNGVFSDIIQERENVKDEGNWHSGTIIWKCPYGHRIYRKGYTFHALRTSE